MSTLRETICYRECSHIHHPGGVEFDCDYQPSPANPHQNLVVHPGLTICPYGCGLLRQIPAPKSPQDLEAAAFGQVLRYPTDLPPESWEAVEDQRPFVEDPRRT